MRLKDLCSFALLFCVGIFMYSCTEPTVDAEVETTEEMTSETPASSDGFQWSTEHFEDINILRYQIPGFDKLTLSQKKLVYFLTEAGLAGRDIIYDMNYRHNLKIRRTLEKIVKDYKGDRNTDDWKNLMTYTKRIWFANGIHHHYSKDKFIPKFSKDYFDALLKDVGATLSPEVITAIFDPTVDAKKVNLDESKDLIKGSAVNFYDPDITTAEVDAFYEKKMKNKDPKRPISYGLNSKLVRNADGSLSEKVWKLGGMYGPAIKGIIGWLEKAVEVAENDGQRKALELLIKYYQTGDLSIWDDYNVAWTKATEGDIDYINGFVEVYEDPKGFKGTYENIVQINDFDASARMAVVAKSAQWFEDHSTIMEEHKKAEVVGVSYKVVVVAGESGDASPGTPIGVNLPNADWIRELGSKSVSLGNIIEAYDNASGPGTLNEFANDDEEIRLAKAHGKLASKMSTALHEVIGHASGKINKGVGTPKETLKSYASALEEARADLVALYFIMDQKIIDLGLMESLDVGIAEYDDFMKNGLMLQLKRIEPGKEIEEAHMRNRALIASWVYEKGKKENVVSMEKKNGKTYVNINDYQKLRVLFGELLREVQRIKSEGDYDAGKALIEDYGVKVDPVLHAEVLERNKKLNIPPYSGFINPRLVPLIQEGKITDVKVEYPSDFREQMMEYAAKYSLLPDEN